MTQLPQAPALDLSGRAVPVPCTTLMIDSGWTAG